MLFSIFCDIETEEREPVLIRSVNHPPYESGRTRSYICDESTVLLLRSPSICQESFCDAKSKEKGSLEKGVKCNINCQNSVECLGAICHNSGYHLCVFVYRCFCVKYSFSLRATFDFPFKKFPGFDLH